MNIWPIVLVFVVDAIIICVAFGAIAKRVWAPLVAQFPERPISEEAFRKKFQTIAIGSVNLGFSVHMAADDDCLHWIPARFMRVFGCNNISIPWTAIHATPIQPAFQKSLARISLNHQAKPILTVPRWCIEIKNTVAPDPNQSAAATK